MTKARKPKQKNASGKINPPASGAETSGIKKFVTTEVAVLAATVLALVIVFSVFTIARPFHLDTTAYFRSVEDLSSGRLSCGYPNRCMVSYFMIPFALFGAHAIKLGFIAAAIGFFVCASLFLGRIFSKPTAYVSSLTLLFIPAGLITITHLKEDFVGLMFLAAALYLTTLSRTWANLLSAVLFPFALLAKESFLVLAPFYFSVCVYYVLRSEDASPLQLLRQRRTWLLFLARVALVAAVTLLINPGYVKGLKTLQGSPYLGQFKGPFSEFLPAGFDAFKRGIGLTPLFWFQLLALPAIYLAKDRPQKIMAGVFLANAGVLAVFSMNNTVLTYRHFVIVAFLTFPPAFYCLELVLRRRWPFYLVAAVAIVASATKSYAYVDFHRRYNPQEGYFRGLKERLSPDAVLLTMDSAGLARHFLGVETKQHPVDATDDQAQAFVSELRNDRKTYYLFPDALSYDANGTLRRRIGEEFGVQSAYKDWFEDYHPMDYGYPPDELRGVLEKQTGCGVTYQVEGPSNVGGVAVELYKFKLACAAGSKEPTYVGYRGKVFTTLTQAPTYRLVKTRP